MARRRRWILVLLLALTAATSALAEEEDGEPGKETPVEPFGPWKVLGVSFGASDEDVRVAFKRLALIHHPDKGGNQDAFVEIRQAFEELTERRERWERRPGGEREGHGSHWWERAERDWGDVMASVRLDIANGGGHLVMPLGHYVRVRGGTTGEVLREAFREGEKVTWTAMGGDGREVASGEATARHRGGPKGEGPKLPGPSSGYDVEARGGGGWFLGGSGANAAGVDPHHELAALATAVVLAATFAFAAVRRLPD
tara:strand:+ start:532 stop:1299 length:768 start_codon:yes stop_codon:yes gene_type:complete